MSKNVANKFMKKVTTKPQLGFANTSSMYWKLPALPTAYS